MKKLLLGRLWFMSPCVFIVSILGNIGWSNYFLCTVSETNDLIIYPYINHSPKRTSHDIDMLHYLIHVLWNVLILEFMILTVIWKNKTNHQISNNSHPSATANKAILSLKIGGGVTNPTGTLYKYWQSMKRCTRRSFRKIIPHQGC